MNPDRQLILAQEILDLSSRIAEQGDDADHEHYVSLQGMAEVLARSLVNTLPEQMRLLGIVEENAKRNLRQSQELARGFAQLLNQPELLNKIRDRIENDDIVEFDAPKAETDCFAKCLTSKVRYTCEFEATVAYGVDDDVQDAVSDIDIPEGGANNSQYQENTFNVISVDGELQ